MKAVVKSRYTTCQGIENELNLNTIFIVHIPQLTFSPGQIILTATYDQHLQLLRAVCYEVSLLTRR